PARFPAAGQSTDNLGSFFLATDLFNYTGARFSLRVTLLPPFDPARNRSAVVRATLRGTITREEGSPNSVTIKFDKVPLRLTGGYAVTIRLKDLTLVANGDEERIVAGIELRGP